MTDRKERPQGAKLQFVNGTRVPQCWIDNLMGIPDFYAHLIELAFGGSGSGQAMLPGLGTKRLKEAALFGLGRSI